MFRIWFMCVLLSGLAVYYEIGGFAPRTDPPDVAVADHQSAVLMTKPGSAEQAPDPATRRALAQRLLNRPLFAQSRRPEMPVAAVQRPNPPRLAGIIASPEGSYAIFQPDGPAKSLVVRSGEAMEQWKVLSIYPDAVTVSYGDERLVLRPTSAPTASSPAPTQVLTTNRPRDASGRHIRPPSYLERRV